MKSRMNRNFLLGQPRSFSDNVLFLHEVMRCEHIKCVCLDHDGLWPGRSRLIPSGRRRTDDGARPLSRHFGRGLLAELGEDVKAFWKLWSTFDLIQNGLFWETIPISCHRKKILNVWEKISECMPSKSDPKIYHDRKGDLRSLCVCHQSQREDIFPVSKKSIHACVLEWKLVADFLLLGNNNFAQDEAVLLSLKVLRAMFDLSITCQKDRWITSQSRFEMLTHLHMSMATLLCVPKYILNSACKQPGNRQNFFFSFDGNQSPGK